MRHLISIALLIVGAAACAVGFGPLFFGQPLLGGALLLAGLCLEMGFWLRLLRARRPAAH
jgi:hypothetical protein